MQTSTQMASLNLDFVNEDEKEDELQTLKNVEPTQRSSCFAPPSTPNLFIA